MKNNNGGLVMGLILCGLGLVFLPIVGLVMFVGGKNSDQRGGGVVLLVAGCLIWCVLGSAMESNNNDRTTHQYSRSYSQSANDNRNQKTLVGYTKSGDPVYMSEKKSSTSAKPKKQYTYVSSSSITTDPYDADSYDDPDDFADEWAEEFGDGDADAGWDDAWDYWHDRY